MQFLNFVLFTFLQNDGKGGGKGLRRRQTPNSEFRF